MCHFKTLKKIDFGVPQKPLKLTESKNGINISKYISKVQKVHGWLDLREKNTDLSIAISIFMKADPFHKKRRLKRCSEFY